MSHSPVKYTRSDTERYTAGWAAIYDMVRKGGSWSGRERHCALLNVGDGRFADISSVSGLDFQEDGRGVAVVDWDRDGRLDLWVTNRTGPRLRFLRNAASGDNHFLSVRLEGRHCNRDAIGARVELMLKGGSDRRLVKTLRAGDGYLAQSSKWIHFGLGRRDGIDRVLVRWPGGDVESFHGLAADQRFDLAQGRGVARPSPAVERDIVLASSELEPPTTSEQSRIVLASRIAMPELRYLDANGASLPLCASDSGPMLIHLWASWCENCLTELAELVAHEQSIQESGLKILTLSVDATGDRPKAERTLARLKSPFPRGFAQPELVEILDILQSAVTDRHRRLPLPAGFLLDEKLRLAVIYKGPVRARALLADVALLREGDGPSPVPFAGKWHRSPTEPDLAVLAQKYSLRGFTDVASEYLILAEEQHDSATAAGSPRNRVVLVAAELNQGTILSRQGHHDRAILFFKKVQRLDPGCYEAYLGLGNALAETGKHEAAVEQFDQALVIQPELAEAHIAAGNSLAAIGRDRESFERFQSARKLESGSR
ncbi:MAG: ASPIC/UnbV domain-containing protein [Planctomycetota bacterium]|nr:ASPIC/UnbV domain-containing protein [Planctomycetota bacterium]